MKITLYSLLLSFTLVCTELPICYAEDTPPWAPATEEGDYDSKELTQWWKRELKRRNQACKIISKIKKQGDVEKATEAIREIFTKADGSLKDPLPGKKAIYLQRNKYKDIWVDQDTQIRTGLPENLLRKICELSQKDPREELKKRNVTPDTGLEEVVTEYLSQFPGVF